MIAYPPQKRPSIKEQFEAWKARMATVPDLMLEHLRGSGLVCPRCGMEMTVRRGRRSERWMVFHPACDDMGGFAWWGATREEAIAEFQNFSGGVEGHAAKVSPAVAEGLGLTPQSHPKGAFQGVPLKDRSGNQAPPAENLSGQVKRSSPTPTCASQIAPSNGIASPARAPSKVGSLTPPSATFQGMEFSAEGLSDEAVNSLLTMKEEG